MSSYFNQHRLKYFQTLFKTTSENDWEKWITFFLKGIISQSRRYSRAMLQILKIHDKLQKKFPQLNQKGHAFLLQHPVFTGASYRATGNPADLLQELENAGWVSRSEEDTFHVVPLLKILQSLQKQKAPGKNSPGA